MPKILIVEDDLELAGKLRDWLTFEKHTVDHVANGRDAIELLRVTGFDLLVLDWEMPEMSGVQVCSKFRELGGSTPILMLTGRSSIDAKEAGLDAGADDYMTKPFEVRELSARIRALLRRPRAVLGASIEVGQLTLETVSREVRYHGREIALQPKEFALLEFLMRHPGEPFNADTLLQRVWTSDSESSNEVVYTCLTKLRKKLGAVGHVSPIKTVHGVGYKIEA